MAGKPGAPEDLGARDDVDASQRPARMLAGRYHLTERLGSGGAATVWRATDTILGRPVAIKLLHPELERDPDTLTRFRREATSAAALGHPNAVVIYDIGEDEGHAYLVMELVEGPTLADLLAQGPLDADAAAAVGYQVALALGDAHARGLVHRDVKPANVLLTGDGSAKVVDFGIAKALGEAQSRVTTPGTVVGTAAYLAPEQLRDEDVDARVDVYALGLVLHEALTGESAFGSGSPVEVAARRLASDPPTPTAGGAGVSEELAAVVARATRRAPADRYTDGTAMARALEPLVSLDPLASIATSVVNADVATTTTINVQRDNTAAIPIVGDPDVDDTTAAPDRDAGDDGRRDTGRRRAVVVAALALLALGVVGALALMGGDQPGDPAAGPSPQADGQPAPDGDETADSDPDGGPVEIAGASDFDPLGNDGEEHPDEVGLAVDGDPGTEWTTAGYASPDLGGLKSGVGISFDLGEVEELDQMIIDVPTPGADFEVYTFEDAPTGGPDSWGEPVATVTGTAGQETVTLDTSGRHVLVWFTSLSAESGNRAGVAEVAFS